MTQLPDPKRGEVWLVNFDPTVGSEIKKTRPAVVMSVDSLGRLPLHIVVPITDWQPHYISLRWFVQLSVDTSNGLIKTSGADAFQVKSVSKDRFTTKLGKLTDHQVRDIAVAIALCVGYLEK